MDIKLLNLNKEKIEKEDRIDQSLYKDLFKEKIFKMMGLVILKEKYFINDNNNDYIEYLCLDDNKRLALIEFRYDRDAALIKEGLNHIDYIKNHLSEFKIIVSDMINDTIKDVIFDPYLIIIASNLNKNDYNAISHLPYDIELYTLNKYKNNAILNKSYISRKMNLNSFDANIDSKYKNICMQIIDYVLDISEEISLYGYKNKMVFKRLNAFLLIEFNDDLMNIYIKKNNKWNIIKNNDIDRIYDSINKAVDEN